MKLPKKYITQYGISARAWREYKKSLKKKSVSTRGKSMPKKKYRRKSTSMFGKLNRPLVGALGVVAYESFISPMIPLQGTAKDLLELLGGLYLSRKKGFIGATGQSLVTINSYQLVSGLVGNKLQGLMNISPTSGYSYT